MYRNWVATFILLLAVFSVRPAFAERPSGPRLLPNRTVALVRVRNFQETREKFGETSLGRIMTDPDVGPLLSNLYGQAQDAYARVEEQVGVSLDKLLALPQGEIWLAVVPPEKEGPISVALLIDVGDQLPTATKLLERGEEVLLENGGSKEEETLAGQKVNLFMRPGASPPRRETRRTDDGEREELLVDQGTVIQFEREGTLVISSTAILAQEIIETWDGKKVESLAENTNFAAIMNRSVSTKDPPEFEWYVDPISLAKAAARGNAAAQTGLALLPALGIDGVKGIGGTITFSTGEFDSISHVHLLLEDPKSGVLEVLQMGAGDSTPEAWVPADAVSYTTLHWNLQESYSRGTKVYDSFFGEGSASDQVKRRLANWLDADFETELLPVLDGRFTLAAWNEPPARLNSQANLIGVKLTDPKKFQPVLDRIIDKYPERFEKQSFGTTTYYRITLNQPEADPEAEEIMRQPEPCMGLVGDYLLLSDSEQFFKHCLTTIATGKTLADEIDYKLIANKIGRQVGGQKPGLVSFSRPEEGLRSLYEFATSDSARRSIARQAEGNEFFRRLDESLRENPLPPFAAVAKYLAPSGSMMTQDETGFHYTSFSLKRK
jgi:hypothetical protein